MHRIAEDGIAAHWSYKKTRFHDKEGERFAWLKQIVDLQKNLKTPRNCWKVCAWSFTRRRSTSSPPGDVKELPQGATPVDFAYAVHTEVGHRCTGAKVNGRMVPLRHELANGDIVDTSLLPPTTAPAGTGCSLSAPPKPAIKSARN